MKLFDELGRLIVNSGDGDGISALSDLTIDADKNWAGKNITNFGAGAHDVNAKLTELDNVTSKSGVATLTVAERGTILVSAAAAYTLTLPTAAGNTGLTYHFLKIDANYNLITLDGDGAETFNYENDTGAPALTYPRLNTYGAEITVVSDGANWQCINEQLGQVPMCNVYSASDQLNLIHGNWTVINLDTENFDIGDNFNTTTHRFTAPIPGKYLFIGAIKWTSLTLVADKTVAIRVFLNDASTIGDQYIHTSSTVRISSTVPLVIYGFAQGDFIEFEAYHSCGVNTVDIDGHKGTFGEVKLVSKD